MCLQIGGGEIIRGTGSRARVEEGLDLNSGPGGSNFRKKERERGEGFVGEGERRRGKIGSGKGRLDKMGWE